MEDNIHKIVQYADDSILIMCFDIESIGTRFDTFKEFH